MSGPSTASPKNYATHSAAPRVSESMTPEISNMIRKWLSTGLQFEVVSYGTIGNVPYEYPSDRHRLFSKGIELAHEID